MKKKVMIFGIAAVAGLAALLIVNRIYFPTNVAETSPDNAEAALRTRRYKTDLATFISETAKLIPTLTKYGSNWKLVSSETDGNVGVIKAEVPVVIFTDDLTVTATSTGDDSGVVVNIHSKSRVGKSDIGENRRHLLIILAALDQKFQPSGS